jgi:Lrp/AsnC family transcriptional regulator, leucine-responsive regulatory protein
VVLDFFWDADQHEILLCVTALYRQTVRIFYRSSAAIRHWMDNNSEKLYEIGMKFEKLDKSDKIILRMLQDKGQTPIAELAEKAGLSPSACHRRVGILESEGFIESYAAQLNRKKLGLVNEFFVEVSLTAQSEQTLEKFEAAVQRVPEILECHLMSGQFDYLLRVIARDAEDYELIHRQKLTRLPGVQRIQSSLALREVKAWSGLPIV